MATPKLTSSNVVINREVFDQLLSMDDGDDHEFSKSLVQNYFEQAETTLLKMKTALDDANLPELGSLGHFLKGSSAALGFDRVKDICERMQHYGKCKDMNGSILNPDSAISLCRDCVNSCEFYYEEIKEIMKRAFDASTIDLESFLDDLLKKE